MISDWVVIGYLSMEGKALNTQGSRQSAFVLENLLAKESDAGKSHLEHGVDLGLFDSEVGRGDEQAIHRRVFHPHGVPPPQQRILPSHGFPLRLFEFFALLVLLGHLLDLFLGPRRLGPVLGGGTRRVDDGRGCRRREERDRHRQFLGALTDDGLEVRPRLQGEGVDDCTQNTRAVSLIANTEIKRNSPSPCFGDRSLVSFVKLVVSFGSGPTTRASRCSLDMVTEIWSARRWWVMASVMFVARTPGEEGRGWTWGRA